MNPVTGESMNACSYSGRISPRGVALRYLSSGKPELNFRLLVPNGERDGKRFVLPVDITVYGQSCEPLAALLEPDDLVELTGQNTWPKPPTKPGGSAIPAAICFSVTRLMDAAQDEQATEASPVATEPEPVATLLEKTRKPRYPKWKPTAAESAN